jgi:hypothetical protein
MGRIKISESMPLKMLNQIQQDCADFIGRNSKKQESRNKIAALLFFYALTYIFNQHYRVKKNYLV